MRYVNVQGEQRYQIQLLFIVQILGFKVFSCNSNSQNQFPIFGKNRKKTERLTLELVAKVNFERDAAYYLMGDTTVLQVDITEPASENIIKDWEPSEWFGGN